jgi:hypothetical protein
MRMMTTAIEVRRTTAMFGVRNLYLRVKLATSERL